MLQYFQSPLLWARSCGLLLCVWSTGAVANLYSASLDNSEWRVDGSELACHLVQPIPGYGEGVFTREAGQGQSFSLKPRFRVLPEGDVMLGVEAPAWKPSHSTRPLGYVETFPGPEPLDLGAPYAQRFLAALAQGMQPTISAAGDDILDPVKISMSTVNFAPAYDQYNQCLAKLLPVGFDQIARSAIFFSPNKSGLSSQVREQLDLIARYVKADDSIRRVFVDGHTDDTGPKAWNLRLSKIRAQAITNYLAKAGVSKKMLVTRFHADRYPVTDNKNAEERSRNRRVTVRLEKNI